MHRQRNGLTLFIVGLALMLAACATTPIGKAIQSADLQQRIVHEAAVQVAMIHLQGGIPAPTYETIKKAYGDWRAAQIALAQSIATWKAVGTPENDSKVTAALTRLGPLAESYLKLVARWVNLDEVQKKVSALDRAPAHRPSVIVPAATKTVHVDDTI